MSIEHAILGLLSLKPLSGYDIKKMFEGSTALYWSGNNNQIYKTLLKLHEQGLVRRETEFQESGPARKIYTITDDGLDELRQWVSADPEIPQAKNPFLIQLAWADLLDADALDHLLEKYESEIRMQLAMASFQKLPRDGSALRKSRDEFTDVSEARSEREKLLWRMILENRESFYQAELDWVLKLRAEIKKVDHDSQRLNHQ